MGTSTVSGPFRSANGFQELVNGQWVPVAGGGGTTFVELSSDNLFSNNRSSPTPSGPTAGTIIELPTVPVGGTITVIPSGGGSNGDVWKVQVSTPAGADVAILTGSVAQLNDDGFYSSPSFSQPLGGSGIPTSMFFYGYFLVPFQFIRLPDFVVPGFGTVAVYQPFGIAVMPQSATELGNVNVYPFTNLLAP